ncbi:MAG: ATP-grasp domain-containing protein [Ruminococcus sp.]|nr:ATP-grasp domain-containing protein [Ruminococcus sp.]
MLGEYDAALDTGIFDVILFSYEKWFCQGVLSLDKKPEKPGANAVRANAIYRGWMMKPAQYAEFYARLSEKGVNLLTSPKQYELFHIFPNIYPQLAEDTVKMLVYPDGKVDLDEVRRTFARFMVKDYVKSVKGTAFPAYFENTVTDGEFAAAMELFYKYRGGLLTGGICVKEYIELKKYGDRTNEYRVFYMNGTACTVSRNSNQQSFTAEPPKPLIQKYENLDSPFYTIDYAELSDGSWKIIEAGDGQVSGLSPGQDARAYYRALYAAFRESL